MLDQTIKTFEECLAVGRSFLPLDDSRIGCVSFYSQFSINSMAYPVLVILSTVESWWSIQGKKRCCEGNCVMDRMPVNFREVLVCNTPSSLGRYMTRFIPHGVMN